MSFLSTIAVCVCVLVSQSFLTLCNLMDCGPPDSSVHGISQARIWNGLLFPSPGDLPDPGIKPKSPALQADSLPSEPTGPSQVVLVVKEPTCQCRRGKRRGFDPWVRRIPWRTKWLPTPAFLPGKFHGQRSLAGYGPWGHKQSDMNVGLRTHSCIPISGVRLNGLFILCLSEFESVSGK